MSKNTKLQWCDSTNNPVMGCYGCELWPTIVRLVIAILSALCISKETARAKHRVRQFLEGKLPSDIYHDRHSVAQKIAEHFEAEPQIRSHKARAIETAIKSSFLCYAGILHLRHGLDDTQPEKWTNPGYAPKFEEPTLFPGRMAEAARWSDLRGQSRPNKPWLNGLPRLIFVSDMADALSSCVPFEYLQSEIIDVVNSLQGKRHIWLWLTKRPTRMADFSNWLIEQGVPWPDHLVAMTSVTSDKTVGRVAQLNEVRCKYRGLSVEPLWTPVTLPLAGIDWCIVGGESGPYAHPFNLDWARDILSQCREAGSSPFMKQMGSNPAEGTQRLELCDSHGGDWTEWPKDIRVREHPWATTQPLVPSPAFGAGKDHLPE